MSKEILRTTLPQQPEKDFNSWQKHLARLRSEFDQRQKNMQLMHVDTKDDFSNNTVGLHIHLKGNGYRLKDYR